LYKLYIYFYCLSNYIYFYLLIYSFIYVIGILIKILYYLINNEIYIHIFHVYIGIVLSFNKYTSFFPLTFLSLSLLPNNPTNHFIFYSFSFLYFSFPILSFLSLSLHIQTDPKGKHWKALLSVLKVDTTSFSNSFVNEFITKRNTKEY